MERKNTYNYDAQKKYNEKTKVITIKFMPNEIDFLNHIDDYCKEHEISRQALIKTAIRDLIR